MTQIYSSITAASIAALAQRILKNRMYGPISLATPVANTQPMNDLYESFWAKTYNKKHWPHQYTVNPEYVFEAERWCWEHFKGRNWNNTHKKFVFKRSQDAFMFALRWS